MGLFKDVPKPICWPPPTGATEVNSLLEYGSNRDPIGHQVHTGFACLFLFCLPLATAPASISIALLAFYSVLRLPTTWRCLTPLLKSKAGIAFFAWACWSTLSILWSAEKTVGLDHATSMWVMAIPTPFLLWPVVSKWRWLLGAFLAGVLLQNSVQIAQLLAAHFDFDYSKLIPEPKSRNRPSGWTSHPGNSSIFMTFAVTCWLMLLITVKKAKYISFAGLVLGLFGIVVAQSRGVWLGFTFSMLFMLLLLLKHKLVSMKKVFFGGLLIAIVASSSSLFIFTNISKRVQEVPVAITSFFNGETGESGTQVRLDWWATGLKQSVESPMIKNIFIGQGLGSSKRIISNDGFEGTSHPHNAFVQIFYECGLFGLGLFAWLLFAVGCRFNQTEQKPLFVITSVAVICWSTVAFFDGGQNSGRVLALFSIFVCLGSVLNFNAPNISRRTDSLVP